MTPVVKPLAERAVSAATPVVKAGADYAGRAAGPIVSDAASLCVKLVLLQLRWINNAASLG